MERLVKRMAVCIRCGKDDSEIDKWAFCQKRKEFVCRNCEHKCEHYSSAMLPNGTHCKYSFGRENDIRRLLKRNFLASPSAIKKARKLFEKKQSGELTEEFRLLAARYRITVDEAYRNTIRVQLAAMQSILRERYAQDSKSRFMFKTDEEVYGRRRVV